VKLPKTGNENKVYLKEVNLPESGKECLPESGNDTYPNQVNTKDKHTKDNKDNINKPLNPPNRLRSIRLVLTFLNGCQFQSGSHGSIIVVT
jgi:hypothetical protein